MDAKTEITVQTTLYLESLRVYMVKNKIEKSSIKITDCFKKHITEDLLNIIFCYDIADYSNGVLTITICTESIVLNQDISPSDFTVIS